jgi:hypothetical protein
MRTVLISNRKELELVVFDGGKGSTIGPLARLIRCTGCYMQAGASHADNVLNVGLMKMSPQYDIDILMEFGFDVRTLLAIQPFQWMMDYRDIDASAEFLKILNCVVKAAAADPKSLVVIVILTEQRTVQWQNTNYEAANIDSLHWTASRINRE